MEKESLVPSMLCKHTQNSEVNLGSLSDMMIFGIPVLGMTLFQKRTAVSMAVSSLNAMKVYILVTSLKRKPRRKLLTQHGGSIGEKIPLSIVPPVIDVKRLTKPLARGLV